jgi:hypothetical protein
MKITTAKLFATTLFAFALTSPTHAVESINVQTFNPSTSDHFVVLEDGFKSEWPKKSKFYFGANYNYVSDPLVVLDATQTTKSYNIIDSIQTMDLFFGMKAANNLAFFIASPIHFISFPSSFPPGTLVAFPTGNKTAFGDLKLMAKIRMTDDTSNTNISLIPEIHLPTGSTAYFLSDASAYLGVRAALERQFESWTLLVNLGFAAASNSRYQDAVFSSPIDYRKRLITGVGGFLPFNDQWGMNIEVNNINMLPFDKNLNPNDAYAGIRYAANDNLIFTGGASVGRIGGSQGQEIRAIAGVRYTISEEQKQAPKPLPAIPVATPAPSPTPKPAPAVKKITKKKK